jgi:hypothetical protein
MGINPIKIERGISLRISFLLNNMQKLINREKKTASTGCVRYAVTNSVENNPTKTLLQRSARRIRYNSSTKIVCATAIGESPV